MILNSPNNQEDQYTRYRARAIRAKIQRFMNRKILEVLTKPKEPTQPTATYAYNRNQTVVAGKDPYIIPKISILTTNKHSVLALLNSQFNYTITTHCTLKARLYDVTEDILVIVSKGYNSLIEDCILAREMLIALEKSIIPTKGARDLSSRKQQLTIIVDPKASILSSYYRTRLFVVLRR